MVVLTNSQAVGFADMQEYSNHGRTATQWRFPQLQNPALAPHQQPGEADYSVASAAGANVIGM